MAMKEFKITYKKYGNVCTYDKEETIKATSEKMAWKKFFDSKSYDPVRKMSRRQWMDYDRDANGNTYGDFKATLISE